VATLFAQATLVRYTKDKRPQDLAWTISLAMFALASAALATGVSTGWDNGLFRIFFLLGAVLTVPWLALGTVYLLAGEVVGNRVRAWLIGLSGLSIGIVLFAPTRTAVSGHELPTGTDVFGVAPRVLAGVGSGVAATVIIAGAIWSAVRVVRRRSPALGTAQRSPEAGRRLVAGNLLIALGTLVLSASGTLAGRLGKDRAFALTLVVGIGVLFAGFLVASSPARALQSVRAAQPTADAEPADNAVNPAGAERPAAS
jgi:hypothetical protein